MESSLDLAGGMVFRMHTNVGARYAQRVCPAFRPRHGAAGRL